MWHSSNLPRLPRLDTPATRRLPPAAHRRRPLVTDLDEQVAAILRRAKKPVLLVANETDNHELQDNAPEFYSLDLGDPYCISAVTGSGTGDDGPYRQQVQEGI